MTLPADSARRLLLWLAACIVLAALCFAALLFIPKSRMEPFVTVRSGEGLSAVSRQLAQEGAIYSRPVFWVTARLLGNGKDIHAGRYRLPKSASSWTILRRLLSGKPDAVTVLVIEGMRFDKMRQIIAADEDLEHTASTLSDATLLKKIDPDTPYTSAEGLFFPAGYEVGARSSDLEIYRLAYRTMQKKLQAAWDGRAQNLPYKTPYELLIAASLIEKETGHPEDRVHVSAVFVNRLRKGMRLQTDPTVIYGMGSRYRGKITKADLRRDTPYNTYTRAGLPPTPIALPGEAALQAAAHPSSEDYLYFVATNDGTGRSRFSYNLDEHNAAVRRYILNR